MKVIRVEKDGWKKFSSDAHRICFQERRPSDLERVDFALLVVSDGDVPFGYITCREWDHETLYWQFGGSFPSAKNTLISYRAYMAAKEFCEKDYKRITTYIENKNTPMLKFAMKIGFRITGIRNYKNEILLEHLLEL